MNLNLLQKNLKTFGMMVTQRMTEVVFYQAVLFSDPHDKEKAISPMKTKVIWVSFV